MLAFAFAAIGARRSRARRGQGSRPADPTHSHQDGECGDSDTAHRREYELRNRGRRRGAQRCGRWTANHASSRPGNSAASVCWAKPSSHHRERQMKTTMLYAALARPFHRIALSGGGRGAFAAVLPCFVLGCVSSPPARPAALDPSNPTNPESPLIANPTPTAPTVEPTAPMNHAHHHGGSMAPGMDMSPGATPMSSGDAGMQSPSVADAGTVVYSCPMHPEVRQSGPGRCAKCGMTLVPTDAGAPMPPMNHAMDGGM